MEDNDRLLLQMAVIEGQISIDQVTIEDLVDFQDRIMDVIIDRKIAEGCIYVDRIYYLQ